MPHHDRALDSDRPSSSSRSSTYWQCDPRQVAFFFFFFLSLTFPPVHGNTALGMKCIRRVPGTSQVLTKSDGGRGVGETSTEWEG